MRDAATNEPPNPAASATPGPEPVGCRVTVPVGRESRPDPDAVAEIPMLGLEWVWFYVTGTLCNLECEHCLVEAGPASRLLLPLEVREFERALQEVAAVTRGRPFQIGFTGGEVFILKSSKFQRRLFDFVEAALQHADLLILTNGLLADERTLARLRAIEARSAHEISYRMSLEGPTAEGNDAIRRYVSGRPTFESILQSLQRFARHGLRPVVTYTYEGTGRPEEVVARKANLEAAYRAVLAGRGLAGLDLWGIPFFDLGHETRRRERLGLPHIVSPGITNHCIATYAEGAFDRFQCAHSRAFAKEEDGRCGWYKCPILPSERLAPGSRIGETLAESLRPARLEHEPCITCFHAAAQGSGMSCSGPKRTKIS